MSDHACPIHGRNPVPGCPDCERTLREPAVGDGSGGPGTPGAVSRRGLLTQFVRQRRLQLGGAALAAILLWLGSCLYSVFPESAMPDATEYRPTSVRVWVNGHPRLLGIGRPFRVRVVVEEPAETSTIVRASAEWPDGETLDLLRGAPSVAKVTDTMGELGAMTIFSHGSIHDLPVAFRRSGPVTIHLQVLVEKESQDVSVRLETKTGLWPVYDPEAIAEARAERRAREWLRSRQR